MNTIWKRPKEFNSACGMHHYYFLSSIFFFYDETMTMKGKKARQTKKREKMFEQKEMHLKSVRSFCLSFTLPPR